MKKNAFPVFVAGLVCGVLAAGCCGYLYVKLGLDFPWERIHARVRGLVSSKRAAKMLSEDFTAVPLTKGGTDFSAEGWLSLQLANNGRFDFDPIAGIATQVSGSYLDSALIRSTHALPKTYKLTATVGRIDYGLEKISGLKKDPRFPEGPLNENGCYLLTIIDGPPDKEHTNIWWHQHRKVTVDDDNNVWGQGMPHPFFMIYFNKDNRLRAYDPGRDEWSKDWVKALTYDPQKWYDISIEKTMDRYILTVNDLDSGLIKRAEVPLAQVWHAKTHPDYFVLGDPHINYYQGSLQIKKITLHY